MSAERHTPEVKRLKKRILTLTREITRLAIDRTTNWARADRVTAWMRDPNRKSANLAFTAGPERQIAYYFEMALFAQHASELKKSDGGQA